MDATAKPDRPVDLVHLARHTLGNRDLEREVLRLFVRQSAVYLGRLRNARTAGEMRVAAHTIKGSARGIGAWRIAELANLFEEAAAEGATMDDAALADLAAAIEAANDYIHTVLSD
ncbi:HPt (histidine-containing phosphotransfer) domain-containing protein [Rhodobium orientis]|nr:Hpt domain-containing protein [Rhodobium orientis]MBB4301865.1 HPt (histidine-containing phosphotransfer) domain-containing protein [Rhodobium orientis]